jgi:hypothetical protein
MTRVRAVAASLAVAVLAGCLGGDPEPRGSGGSPAARGRGGAKPEQYWPARARYRLALTYDAGAHALAGTERVEFVNTSPEALRSVWLRTWANGLGSCRRPFARVEVTAGGSAGEQRAGCTALEVRLARPLPPGERAVVALRVRVAVPPRPGRFGLFGDIASFGNALPVLAVADARGWRLEPYTDRGESFFSLTAAWRVELRVPEGLEVASTGREVAAGVLEAPLARDFTLVIGPMQVHELQAGGIRLQRFTAPGEPAGEARAALRTARSALTELGRRFGPLDATELDLVEGPGRVSAFGIAMEYPDLVLSPAAAPALTHELAHQWFFGLVGNDQWREPWLDESFAEYAQASLRSGGPDRLGACGRLPRGRPPLNSDMGVFERRPPRVYTQTVYIGGACSLRELERDLGRARFDAFLRGLVAGYRHEVLTTEGFVAALREAVPERFDVDRWLRAARLD